VTLVPMTAAIAAPVPAIRPAPLDRLPGTADDDPFLRLAAGGSSVIRRTLPRPTAATWRRLGWVVRASGVHPLAAERYHVDPRTTRRYDRSRHNLDRSPQLSAGNGPNYTEAGPW
jgi:hypothetical protein